MTGDAAGSFDSAVLSFGFPHNSTALSDSPSSFSTPPALNGSVSHFLESFGREVEDGGWEMGCWEPGRYCTKSLDIMGGQADPCTSNTFRVVHPDVSSPQTLTQAPNISRVADSSLCIGGRVRESGNRRGFMQPLYLFCCSCAAPRLAFPRLLPQVKVTVAEAADRAGSRKVFPI